jgi:DNA-binding MarR family transcriptional regulator
MKDISSAQALISLIVADIFELAGRFRDIGESIARRVGQTQARWQVMSAASGDPLTVPQIARRLGVTRQGVQRIADLLVSEDWATFERNPDHRASPLLVLSERGKSALAEITEAAQDMHAALAQELSKAEIDDTHRTLRRLINALDQRHINEERT